jgi:tetratricopeptide (TPR) repeat protein
MGRKSRLRQERRATEPHERIPSAPRAEQAAPSGDRKTILIAAALLIVAIAIVFAQVRSQDYITFDDPEYVTANSVVKGGLSASGIGWAFTGFRSANWHPLTWISHMLDVQLFGVSAPAEKLVNVAMHIGAALFLLLFLVRATGAIWPSVIVAALFALHPTRVESVAWVAERKDVLSALLFMIALYLYAGYAKSGRRALLIAVTIVFALALMAKPSVITLPFVLLLLDYWPLQRVGRTPFSRLLIEKIPLFMLVILSIIVTLRAQTEALVNVSLGSRVQNAIVAYADYLRMLVWPARLAIFYPTPSAVSAATVLFAFVLLVAITIVVLLYARRFPFLTVGWLWYVGTLVPMSGIVKAGIQWIADRYTYLSYVGLFIAIVWGVWALVANRPALARAFAALAIVVIAVLSVATFLQLRHWKDAQTLFTRTLEVTTKNPVAEANLAMVLYDRDKPKEALPHIQASVQIDPAISSSQYTLGRVLEANGDVKGAEQALRQAIALDPNFVRPYRALANLRQKAGFQSEALMLLTKASALDENDASARAELAAAKGDVNAALAEYESAIAQSPDDANLRNDYATILARQQRDQQALDQYLEVLRLRPDHFLAHMNVGALLRRLGRDSEAIAHLMKAATLRPTAPEPHVYLALIYGVRKETSRALAEIDAAMRLDAAGANRYFTEVVRVPFRETNLADYRALLLSQTAKGRT